MKSKLFIILVFILIFRFDYAKGQEGGFVPKKYVIDIQIIDSTMLVNLQIDFINERTTKKRYLLFNRYIRIEEALLNQVPMKYSRGNDTLYLESCFEKLSTLSMKYEIPLAKTVSSKIISSYSDSIYTYPLISDTAQLFFERSSKWYPVLYDNFSEYYVTITVPANYMVFAYPPETHLIKTKDKNRYVYDCYDEEFPFFITPSNIFWKTNSIQTNSSIFSYYFLPRVRRLLAISNKEPVFTSDSIQIDSLLWATISRSVAAIDWYQTNLWKKEIKKLNFIETGILGLGVGIGNFILMDRILMNREAVDKYSLSHEIVHLWLGIHTEYLSKGKFFLGESIPEYVNLLFYESWAGENLFENAIREKTELTYSSGNFFTVSFEQVLNQRKGSANSDEIIYDKGPLFVHEFRKMVGKEKLLKIIRETYSPPNHFVTIQDLENNIKKNGCWAQYLKLFELNL